MPFLFQRNFMSTHLDPQAHRVAEHYENKVIEYQKIRLERESPVEFELTKRTMKRWIKNDSVVVYVGVGVGHYAVELAQRNCKLHLVDICESFLKLSQERMAQHHLSANILSSTRSSATSLEFIPDNSVDCVLMLGPFYHLVDKKQREKAVAEAYRVLKADGLFFAAGINRLGIFHELFKTDRFFDHSEINIKCISKALDEFFKTGVTNETIFKPLGDAYCATIDEFSALFSPSFKQVDFLGLESFSAYKQKMIFDKKAEDVEIWLSILEKTARTIEGMGTSEHLLYVGKK
jgi:S-adenosylmethionine-dependent methyltransferase